MNRRLAGLAAVVGLLVCASAANAQVTLNLSVEARSVTYDPDSLGRRLTLNNVLGASGGPCPATVTLTDTLPAGTSLVSETLGGGTFDAASHTVTWSAVPPPCVEHFQGFSLTIGVDSSVPNGATVTHTLRVITTAAQTRTDDDTSSLGLQVGFLPLPVSVDSSPSSSGTGCSPDCTFGAIAAVGGSLGLSGHEIGSSGGVVAFGAMGGHAFAGTNPDNATFASASFELNGNVHVTNPNPYNVSLRFVRDDHLWASGSNGLAVPQLRGDANADVAGLGATAGSLNAVQEVNRHFICDPTSCRTHTETITYAWPPPPPPPAVDLNPNADLVVPLEPSAQENTFGDCSRSAVVSAGRTSTIEIDLSGSAQGNTAALHPGFGMFSGSSSVNLSLCSVVPPPRVATLTISAHSPVDLLVTDPSGHRIGFDVAAGHVVNGIFGGQYSGRGSEPQIVTVPEPSAGTYDIGAQGRDTGPFTIDVQTLDGDGNVITTQSMTGIASPGSVQAFQASVGVAADTIPPTTTANPSPSPNTNGWNNTNVTITLASTDNEPGGTGVKEIHFTLTGAQGGGGVVSGSTASVALAAEGTTTLTYFGVDNAGNQEAAKTLTVRIDKTPPSIAGLPTPGCTLWPPDHRLVQVAAVTASDALSGLAPGSLALTAANNESGLSDGNTASDIVIAGTTVQLRAARSGAGAGRIYTLTATASDLAGNRATVVRTCTVPHDQGRTAER